MDDSAYLGDRSHYYVRIDGVENPVAVSAQNLDTEQLFGQGHRGQVWLSWTNDAIV
jgi:hypothetical protein